MERLTREEFHKWAEEQHWLLISEDANPQGRQNTYVNPLGDGVVAVFNLEGKLLGTVKIVPPPPPQPQGVRIPGLGGLPGFQGKG
jgi:hypothetical protein